MNRLLCFFGIHSWGPPYHADRKRSVEIEFPNYKVINVTDERIYRKCALCSAKKLVFSADSPVAQVKALQEAYQGERHLSELLFSRATRVESRLAERQRGVWNKIEDTAPSEGQVCFVCNKDSDYITVAMWKTTAGS